MKKLWKKLLAITTAVMMVIILLPAMANADVASGKGTVEIIKNGETESEYLSDAKFSFYKIASITNTEGKDWIAKGVRLSQILERNAHTAEGSQKLWDYAYTNFIEPNVKTGKIKDDTK